MGEIKILAISDLHWYTDKELVKIKNIDFDICVLLGDIPVTAIRLIKAYTGNKSVLAKILKGKNMSHKFKGKIIGIIILFFLIFINIIFKNDGLTIITGAIALVIVLVLCQTSVIKEKQLENIRLISSSNGERCIGNGRHKGVECMCDECEHYLECFPDWKE